MFGSWTPPRAVPTETEDLPRSAAEAVDSPMAVDDAAVAVGSPPVAEVERTPSPGISAEQFEAEQERQQLEDDKQDNGGLEDEPSVRRARLNTREFEEVEYDSDGVPQMVFEDQLIERHGEDRALQLAGYGPIACRLLKPPYLSMVNEWMPVLGSRLPSLLDAAAFRWVNLLDFLPFYRDHKKWTRVMTRKLMKGINQTKTDQVKEEIWVGIYRKDN